MTDRQALFTYVQDCLHAHIEASLDLADALGSGDEDDIDEARARQVLSQLEVTAALRHFGLFGEEMLK